MQRVATTSVRKWGSRFACAALFLVQSSVFAQSLDDKLIHQFKRYELAQKNILARVNNKSLPLEQRIVSREEWETWLAPTDQMQFTPQDLIDLQNRHQQSIAKAKTEARAKSEIDLDAIRALEASVRQPTIAKFCAAFPKGGMLHIHPWGSFPADALAESFRRANPVIPAKKIADRIETPNSGMILYSDEMKWLRSLPAETSFLLLQPSEQTGVLAMTRLPAGSHSFERFESIFGFVGLSVTTWNEYESLIRAFVSQAAKMKVRYIEFTTGISAEDLMPYQAIIDRMAADFGVTIRINASFSRWSTQEEQNTESDAALLLRHPLVVGIDLLANEEGAPALEKGQVPYVRVLDQVLQNQSTLHRTMHAGELGDSRNPRDAMILGAERLGHGVKLAADPVATEFARAQGIAVEVNLTSNQRLRVVEDIRNHPFLSQLRLGIPVSLSTDDEGIFETNIASECEKAVSLTDVQFSEMKAMSLNSIKTSFLPAAEKTRLLQLVEDDLAKFSSEWKH